MAYQYSGTNAKSGAELDRLPRFLNHPKFHVPDTIHFSHTREEQRLDKFLETVEKPFPMEHGWKCSSVKIHLPKGHCQFPSESEALEFEVGGIYHHDLTNVIRTVFEDEVFMTYNTTPFTQYWKVGKQVQEVFSEAYVSAEMWQAYEEINMLPQEPDDNLECIVASLMMWSDSTHLTNFGDTSLWPFYLFFGNKSKYTRGKPTSNACHHVACIPKLPSDFQAHYMFHHGEPSISKVLTHCRQELMQAIWTLLLDDKVLLSGIKFLGRYPCPWCLVKKSELMTMGTARDMKIRIKRYRVDNRKWRTFIQTARRLIFERGATNLLGDGSYVPTNARSSQNAFSDRLHGQGINFFRLFVVDLLHEFEIGVWKAILTHLFRILIADGGQSIQQLDERYIISCNIAT
ncbi:hypothetical protein OG21DRAFT_1479705 [Imleria badia]|nr:hypothetical protein OG21DRAFT_1479705 [Imleria badia]